MARGGLGSLDAVLGSTSLVPAHLIGGFRGSLALGPHRHVGSHGSHHAAGRGSTAAFALAHGATGVVRDQEASRLVGPHRLSFHQIDRVREEPVEA